MHTVSSRPPGLLASLQRSEAVGRHSAADGRYPVPPVLYVPATTGPAGAVAEVRPTQDGRRALLAYSALDRLLVQCGEAQPWVLLHLSDLESLMAEQPFDLVAFDPEIPCGLSENGRLA